MLPLEADAKRMQNFNHLLHRGFPQQCLGPGLAPWHYERGLAGAPEAYFWDMPGSQASLAALSRGRAWCRDVRTGGQGSPGPAQSWHVVGHWAL